MFGNLFILGTLAQEAVVRGIITSSESNEGLMGGNILEGLPEGSYTLVYS